MARTWWIYSVVIAALGIVLLVPLTFSDPNGVDPHGLRLALVIAGLVAVSYVRDALQPARTVLLAVSAVVTPYVLWSSSFQVVPAWFPSLRGGTVTLIAGCVLFAVTLAIVAGLRRQTTIDLRLKSFGLRAAVFTALGVAAFVVATLAVPATATGRVGIAVPAAIDAIVNGLVAGDVLQATSQEVAFRGALLSALERTLLAWQANLGQAVLFGFGHLALQQYEGPVAPLIPFTILLGLILGWITQKTQSLWPAVVIHLVAEIAVRVAVVPGLYGG